jgi:tetratricopeptide (TPR) repeat protein
MLPRDRGEPVLALQRLEAAEKLASEQWLGFLYEPRFLRAAALSALGAFSEAATCLSEGLADPLGALARLAEALARRGEHSLEGVTLLGLDRLEEAQKVLEEVLRITSRQQAKAHELGAVLVPLQHHSPVSGAGPDVPSILGEHFLRLRGRCSNAQFVMQFVIVRRDTQ